MWIKKTPRHLCIVNAADILSTGMSESEAALLKTCFDECGCLIVEEVFEQSYIDNIKKQFDEKYNHLSLDELNRDHYKISENRYHITMSLTPPFDDSQLYAHPVLLKLAALFLENNFLLDNFVAVQSLPGAHKQRPHRDVPPLFEDNAEISQQLPCYAITMIIPLIDINVECGTTALWPGSHRDLHKKHAQVDQPILPSIPRGAVYLWDYRLVHAGTDNYANYHRPILSLTYTRPWFSDSENFHKERPIHLTKSTYANIPDHAKFLFDKFRWQIKE